jgi:signal transduction histidine kinase
VDATGPRRPYPHRVRSLLLRLGTDPSDAVLAVALAVVGIAQAFVFPIADHGVGELFVLGSTLPLAWRRTRPVEAAAVSSAFWLIPLDGYPVLGFVTVILQFYGLGAYGRPRLAVWLTVVWAAAAGVVGSLLGPEPPTAAIGGVLVVVAPVVAGRLVRQHRAQNHALTELAAELEAEKHKVQEAAVTAERARIAQELHDVVGHELTLIAVQAEAAAMALRTSPDRAVAPVEAIRETAHHTLAEMRSTLDAVAPQTDIAASRPEGLTDLARRAEEAGIANSLVVSGTPWPAQASTWLAVHRIVRECLTNAGRHAPGEPLSIKVDWHPDRVEVDAANAVSSNGRVVPGRGLTGMRHRTELLGGTFHAAAEGGAFVVRVCLPAQPAGGAR